MGLRHHKVELAASFLDRLDSIERFLIDVGAGPSCDQLLADLRDTVVPNLAQFSNVGRQVTDLPIRSIEALAQLGRLGTETVQALRVYVHGEYLILYRVRADRVVLLSIQHHRQAAFESGRC